LDSVLKKIIAFSLGIAGSIPTIKGQPENGCPLIYTSK
jgi:hypothetical protein